LVTLVIASVARCAALDSWDRPLIPGLRGLRGRNPRSDPHFPSPSPSDASIPGILPADRLIFSLPAVA